MDDVQAQSNALLFGMQLSEIQPIQLPHGQTRNKMNQLNQNCRFRQKNKKYQKLNILGD